VAAPIATAALLLTPWAPPKSRPLSFVSSCWQCAQKRWRTAEALVRGLGTGQLAVAGAAGTAGWGRHMTDGRRRGTILAALQDADMGVAWGPHSKGRTRESWASLARRSHFVYAIGSLGNRLWLNSRAADPETPLLHHLHGATHKERRRRLAG